MVVDAEQVAPASGERVCLAEELERAAGIGREDGDVLVARCVEKLQYGSARLFDQAVIDSDAGFPECGLPKMPRDSNSAWA